MRKKTEWGPILIEALEKELERRGHGAITEMERALGVEGQGWWHARRKTEDLYAGWLIPILDHLGLNPAQFLRTVTGRNDLELNKPIGEPPEIVVRAWERFQSEGPLVERVGEDTLKTLDTMRYEKPNEVVTQAWGMVEYCSRQRLPQLLGVAGSAWRLMVELREAEHAIYAAICMAQELQDQPTLANMLQRMAYVYFERPDLESALRIAERATMTFLRCENKVGVARTLVDQGIWLHYLERWEESLSMQRMALDWLPEEERHNRASAFLIIACNFQKLGQTKQALEYVAKAEEEAIHLPRVEMVRVRWVRGLTYEAMGELAKAIAIMEDVVAEWAAVHLGNMALAACDLARMQLLCGKAEDAGRTIFCLAKLLEPLRDNDVACKAIMRLLREESNLSLALVRAVQARLEGELRQRRWWRRLWVNS